MTDSTGSAAGLTDDEFAAEFRAWLDANLTGEFAEIKGTGGPGSEHEFFPQRLKWEKHMAAAGWTCVGWPVEHGGMGLSLRKQLIYQQELEGFRAARPMDMGLRLLAPVLMRYGTPEQKATYLPRILSADDVWCQGYSEPNAGSDLASLTAPQMAAVLRVVTRQHPDPDGYRFLAVRFSAFALDGRTFGSIEEARLTIGEAIHAEAPPG